MFLALDKIHHQGLEKVIIAVPEMSIGGSFKDTDLMKYVFFCQLAYRPQVQPLYTWQRRQGRYCSEIP